MNQTIREGGKLSKPASGLVLMNADETILPVGKFQVYCIKKFNVS